MAEGKRSIGRARNVFDMNTGLPVMVNLFIIKYLYYHIKKADRFMEVSAGKKPKSKEIYMNVLPISRQRFDRINKGIRFELTTAEAERIRDTFGIDIKYFRRDNPVAMELPEISLLDWKCFYNVRHDGQYHFRSGFKEKEIQDRCEKVEQGLKDLASADWGNCRDKNNPFFMIWYYFSHGYRYEEESRIDKYIKALREIRCTDWDGIGIQELTDCHGLLKKQYDYINSLLTIYYIKNEK